MQSDTAKLAQNVAKEREVSEKLLGDLANHISTFKNTPGMVQARQDPYVLFHPFYSSYSFIIGT